MGGMEACAQSAKGDVTMFCALLGTWPIEDAWQILNEVMNKRIVTACFCILCQAFPVSIS
jgi:hypothetical protein